MDTHSAVSKLGLHVSDKNKLNGLILVSGDFLPWIYGPEEQAAIGDRVTLGSPPVDAAGLSGDLSFLRDVEVIFSGWGAPHMGATFLENAPRLKAVFYAGGSIRHLVSEKFWARKVRITSSYAMNSLAVADYTVGAILFGLKQGFSYARHAQKHGSHDVHRSVPGSYESTVGIISLGAAGRSLVTRLREFDLKFIAYDPYVSAKEAAALNVTLVSLEEVFTRADAVSLHTPELPETVGLIRGGHFASMKSGAVFINTARGAVVREREMIDELKRRPDLTAVLDVTEPDPPRLDSPLYSMTNVVLTPHVAGAMGHECRRMGRCMIEEFDRWHQGGPMQWEITEQNIVHMA